MKAYTERERMWDAYLRTPIGSTEAERMREMIRNPRRKVEGPKPVSTIRRRASEMDDGDVEGLEQLYERGVQIASIAARLRTTESVVNVMMRENGVERKRSRAVTVPRTAIQQMKESGLTDKQVADRIGCSVSSVRRYLRSEDGNG